MNRFENQPGVNHMKIAGRMLVAVILATAPLWAAADEERAYIGIAAGFTKTGLDTADIDTVLAGHGLGATTSVDQSDAGIKIYGGVLWSKYLGFELGYTDFGRFRFHSTVTSGGSGTFGGDSVAQSIDFSALGMLPIGEALSLFGRGGFSVWQVKVNASGSGAAKVASASAREVGVAPLLGLGAMIRFTPHISMRAEFERHFSVGGEDTLGKRDLDLMSLAVQYHF